MEENSKKNMESTIAENVKFFVYKCNFSYHDWFGSLNVILKKIECYVIKCSSIVDICTATVIRELCHERVPDRYDYWVTRNCNFSGQNGQSC